MSKTKQTIANLHVVEHALIEHKLTYLRDKNTDYPTFRRLVHEISLILACAATKDMALTHKTIHTPMEKIQSSILVDSSPVIIPILRAGLGMVDAFLTLLPNAKIGHIGLARNERTLQSEHYYFKIPVDSHRHWVFLVDPMLATGGSSVAAVTKLKMEGIQRITMVNIIGAPEGINHFHKQHPDVPIYIGVIDKELNNNAYIVPGLGDAGDRLHGTC